MRPTLIVIATALAVAAGSYALLSGRQSVQLSQLGSVSQVVNTTEISVHYSRPVARERTLFGPEGIVPPGLIWNPGANDATWIEFSKDVQIGGHHVPAGSYSVWADPGEDEWMVAFSNAWNVFHIPYPGPEQDAFRLRVPVEHDDHYFEVMTFHFPEVGPNTTELAFQWGTTRVTFPIEVEMELPSS